VTVKKYLGFLACIGFVLLSVISSCRRSDNGNAGKVAGKAPGVQAGEPVVEKGAQDSQPVSNTASVPNSQPSIAVVTIAPENPTVASIVKAGAVTNPTELQDMELQYVFWRNAAVIKTGSEDTFPLVACRKNDLVYVDAVLFQGKREIARKRSVMVQVLNSSPEIKKVDFPEIKGPGAYHIKVNASDADSDLLTFSLEGSALPAGTEIDATGDILLLLPEKHPENVSFWVVVKDNDQGEVKQELSIDFKKRIIEQKKSE
jgi:hypothetical protein